MAIQAWYMDDKDDVDQREPHKTDPVQPVSVDQLDALGVLSWEGITGEDDPKLAEIRKERGYSYTDVITVSPEKLPGYETKIKSFFEEHIHTDEEIRYILEGTVRHLSTRQHITPRPTPSTGPT
jgi:1,2-dihydroxy-3-keto-5-methylthiopentene dioxygenase